MVKRVKIHPFLFAFIHIFDERVLRKLYEKNEIFQGSSGFPIFICHFRFRM